MTALHDRIVTKGYDVNLYDWVPPVAQTLVPHDAPIHTDKQIPEWFSS